MSTTPLSPRDATPVDASGNRAPRGTHGRRRILAPKTSTDPLSITWQGDADVDSDSVRAPHRRAYQVTGPHALVCAERATLQSAAFAVSWLAPGPRRSRVLREAGSPVRACPSRILRAKRNHRGAFGSVTLRGALPGRRPRVASSVRRPRCRHPGRGLAVRTRHSDGGPFPSRWKLTCSGGCHGQHLLTNSTHIRWKCRASSTAHDRRTETSAKSAGVRPRSSRRHHESMRPSPSCTDRNADKTSVQ